MGLRRITFPVGPLACNCSILGDDASGTALLVDPGAEVGAILDRLAAQHWKLQAILITHAHLDHIGGAAALRRATGSPVWLNPRDRDLCGMLEMQAQWLGVPPPEPTELDAELAPGARLALAGTSLEVLETPGHTPGSVSLYVPSEALLFAGDTLFAGSVGRTDLPGGDGVALQRSLRGQLLTLPDATAVVPGHGPLTTIGCERRSNPFLRRL
ncbi:MAG: MBL fold metallo-hydrolase [Terriglobales bacterium]